MDTELTDVELLRAHVAGDAEAFGLLFARHRDRLWAVALRTCGDPETAADGLQDAMIAAFRRADSFRGDARVTTWLHRVVVNSCLDRLRSAQVRRTDPLPDDLDDAEHLVRTTVDPDPGTDPAHTYDRVERRAAVLEALGRLTPEQRAAVVLVDMEGYSVAEVAEILECAEGTVKSRCSRARARLSVLLADLLPDGEQRHRPSAAPERNRPTGTDVGSGTRRGPPPAATTLD
ncbi:RNA polymerase sigma factor SigM [Nocardioides sambongensis]|uniref:RNA polymerase sigma factor SigM n=1 Tax=Nocardioides sambongensis TaxID=2589074 RepID=UPI001129676A|nr:RNA polymerase sigma factor SigM [Nocardioides sambongensis]